jgi:hypothetical protein
MKYNCARCKDTGWYTMVDVPTACVYSCTCKMGISERSAKSTKKLSLSEYYGMLDKKVENQKAEIKNLQLALAREKKLKNCTACLAKMKEEQELGALVHMISTQEKEIENLNEDRFRLQKEVDQIKEEKSVIVTTANEKIKKLQETVTLQANKIVGDCQKCTYVRRFGVLTIDQIKSPGRSCLTCKEKNDAQKELGELRTKHHVLKQELERFKRMDFETGAVNVTMSKDGYELFIKEKPVEPLIEPIAGHANNPETGIIIHRLNRVIQKINRL